MRNRALEAAANLSYHLYGCLLLLYPASLRLEFGDEMLKVFADQVRRGYQRKGFAGFWRVWFSVAVEIVQLIPSRVDGVRLGIPAASILTSSALFLFFTRLAGIAVPCHK
jgi:hypothetical protein